jgi:acyl carrier protein
MYEKIREIVNDLRKDKSIPLMPDTPLIGGDRVLDSLLLVELCLKLEDLSSEMNFNFDWTSSEAMSKSLGMFRSIGSLTEEFERQMQNKK